MMKSNTTHLGPCHSAPARRWQAPFAGRASAVALAFSAALTCTAAPCYRHDLNTQKYLLSAARYSHACLKGER